MLSAFATGFGATGSAFATGFGAAGSRSGGTEQNGRKDDHCQAHPNTSLGTEPLLMMLAVVSPIYSSRSTRTNRSVTAWFARHKKTGGHTIRRIFFQKTS